MSIFWHENSNVRHFLVIFVHCEFVQHTLEFSRQNIFSEHIVAWKFKYETFLVIFIHCAFFKMYNWIFVSKSTWKYLSDHILTQKFKCETFLIVFKHYDIFKWSQKFWSLVMVSALTSCLVFGKLGNWNCCLCVSEL